MCECESVCIVDVYDCMASFPKNKNKKKYTKCYTSIEAQRQREITALIGTVIDEDLHA